jgi:all-trans-8'-apo-beta-carotenal 15,15'-oxygenase
MPLPSTLLTSPLQDLDLTVVAGAVPDGLHGEMFISAPLVDQRLGYQLFGFGALVRISLTTGTWGADAEHFALRCGVIDTPIRRLHDRAAHRFTGGLLGFDTPWGYPNMANTAPLAFGDRLFATWDVGRPVEVDPRNFGFLGEVGSARSWGGGSFGQRQVIPQIFSTAHPIVDPERHCIWTVKLELGAGGMEASVVRYDGSGSEVRRWPLEGAIVTGSMHTISQTRNWLVLADSGNFKADFDEIMGGERSVTIDAAAPVFLVRKDVLEATAPGTPVPYVRSSVAPTTGHFYAVWDDDDGIRVLFEHMDLMDLGYRLRADDVDVRGRPIDPAHVGMYQMAMGPHTVSEWRFDPNDGASRRTAFRSADDAFNLQLSAQDWSPEGQRAPTHHHVVFQGFRGGAVARRVLARYEGRVEPERFPPDDQPSSLVTFARDGLGEISTYRFPSTGDLPSSPIFVPRPSGRPGGGDGWVVLPVLSDDGFRIDIFDACDVGAGPVATLAPRTATTMPFLLHSVWMPRAEGPVDLDRLRFADDLDEDALVRIDDEARKLVLDVARELDRHEV